MGNINTINTWWYLKTDAALSVPVTINLKPKSGYITGPIDICLGETAVFQTLTIPHALEYIWHLSGPGVEFDIVNDAINDTYHQEFLTSMAPGNYIISVFGRDPQCGDGEKVFHNASIHNVPDAAFTYDNPCQAAGIIFTDQSISADAELSKYTWVVETGKANERNFQGNPALIVFDTVANYNVTHIVTDALGCADTVNRIVSIKPKPKVAFEIIPNLGLNKGELHFDNQTTGASEYSWNFGNNISSFLAEPIIQYTLEGDYSIRLLAINLDGCIDTVVRHYYYMPGFWLPNAFSPNNDGNNEIFMPVTQRNTLDPYKFLIYSRWGELIFETSDPDVGWDGTLNGKPCNAGSYMYVVQYREAKMESSEVRTLRGMVSLIR
jgi:gliding motility-associated-like protein